MKLRSEADMHISGLISQAVSERHLSGASRRRQIVPERIWRVYPSGKVVGPMSPVVRDWGTAEGIRPCGFVHRRKGNRACFVCRELSDYAAQARRDFDARRGKLNLLIAQRDGVFCRECGETDVEQITLDHVVPLNRRGTNDPDNLQFLCRSCNCRKGDR